MDWPVGVGGFSVGVFIAQGLLDGGWDNRDLI